MQHTRSKRYLIHLRQGISYDDQLVLTCAEMQQAEAILKKMNFCSHMRTKEMFLHHALIDGGHLP